MYNELNFTSLKSCCLIVVSYFYHKIPGIHLNFRTSDIQSNCIYNIIEDLPLNFLVIFY